MRCKAHVVGAGLAGLSAAVALTRAGIASTLYEASGQAGGRCRSFADHRLGCSIDNGNHLVLSGNRAVMGYLQDIGAGDVLTGPVSARFPFLDLRTGQRWQLRPDSRTLAWWLLDARRRVPGTALRDYLPGLRLPFAGPTRTVADCVGDNGTLFERFWEPLAVATLNTAPQQAAAGLLWRVLRETFVRGGAACLPRIAKQGLSPAFVDPAVDFLRQQGGAFQFGCRLRRIDRENGRVNALDFGDHRVTLEAGDSVVLAVPPAAASSLLPELEVPQRSNAIVNAHFRLPRPAGLLADLPVLGLIGGTAQWLFVRGEIASVTVSAAGALALQEGAAIARRLWRDVAVALGHPHDPVPAHRVLKEKRATIAQTPRQVCRRPGTRTPTCNLYLAGDWTDTGLPATIEGAIRSGTRAATAVLDS